MYINCLKSDNSLNILLPVGWIQGAEFTKLFHIVVYRFVLILTLGRINIKQHFLNKLKLQQKQKVTHVEVILQINCVLLTQNPEQVVWGYFEII